MKRFLFFLATAAGLVMGGWAADDLEKARAVDTAHLKAIWAALVEYQKAKGDYPPHLADLIPGFLPDEKVLLSPLGNDGDPYAKKGEYDPKYPCSYSYGFSTEGFRGGKTTWREMVGSEREEFGLATPMLRCRLYHEALNINFAGDFFETTGDWRKHAATRKFIAKYGLGPGMTTGKKLTVVVTDPAGQPVPNVRLLARGRRFHDLELPDRTYVSKADGKVSISLGPDPEASLEIVCQAPEWFGVDRAWRFGEEGTIPNSDHGEISFQVSPAQTAGGVVRDAAGAPLPGASVSLYFQTEPGKREWSGRAATTDQQGHWQLGSVPVADARAVLAISHPHHRTYFLSPATVGREDIRWPFSGKADLPLTAPLPVEGTVLADGRPVAGAKVHLLSPETELQVATTDREGHFRLGAQQPGPGVVIVAAPELAPHEEFLEISEQPKPLTISLGAGKSRRMRVVREGKGGVADLPVGLAGFSELPEDYYPRDLPEQPVLGTTGAEGWVVWPHAPRKAIRGVVWLPSGEPFEFEWDTSKDEDYQLTIPDQ